MYVAPPNLPVMKPSVHHTLTRPRVRFYALLVARILWLTITALALEYIVRALPLVYRVVLRSAINPNIAKWVAASTS